MLEPARDRTRPMKILDTDHCVALLRGKLDLSELVPPHDVLATTAISAGELAHGAYKSMRPAENLARVDVLLSTLTVLPYDELAALRFGALKAGLESTGQRLDDMDLQIGAIAIQYGALLMSHNRQHFERVPDLMLGDWLA